MSHGVKPFLLKSNFETRFVPLAKSLGAGCDPRGGVVVRVSSATSFSIPSSPLEWADVGIALRKAADLALPDKPAVVSSGCTVTFTAADAVTLKALGTQACGETNWREFIPGSWKNDARSITSNQRAVFEGSASVYCNCSFLIVRVFQIAS